MINFAKRDNTWYAIAGYSGLLVTMELDWATQTVKELREKFNINAMLIRGKNAASPDMTGEWYHIIVPFDNEADEAEFILHNHNRGIVIAIY
jgi:hypothetical protein